MYTKLSFIALWLGLACCLHLPAKAQKPPDKKVLLQHMQLANRYFMDKWTDPGKEIVTNIARPSNIWTRAVYYEGLMELYKINKDKALYDYAVDWGEKHKWGLRGGTTRNADNQCCGQTYIDLYNIDPRPERIAAIKTSVDDMVKSEKKDDWNWIDALQMAMPVFVRLGTLYKDTAYYRKMWDLYSFAKYSHGTNGLYNPADHLWWRDKDFVSPYKEPNGEDCYWSRGNGWVVAALVRTLELLPKNDPHYKEYLTDYKDMMKAVLPIQRPDGLWNVSLHDSTHFGGKELSGTALFVYGMAWGMNRGLLSKKEYLQPALKAWNAVIRDCLHPDGKLGYVQGTGKEPKDSQPVTYTSTPDFEDYGLGCFLLAGSQLYKLK